MATKLLLLFALITLINCDNKYEDAIKKSVQYIEQIQKEENIPGIVAGISINGSLVWAQGFGQIDIENNVKTTQDAAWRLASISKAVTSALIGKLIDEGRLDLNHSIYDYLSRDVLPIKTWKNKKVDITLGQVMSHTAGLYELEDMDVFSKLFRIYNNVTEFAINFKDEPLHFAPGSQWNYSNYGFLLVGAVIESVLDQTYESAINLMFKELEMNSTVCDRRELIIPNRAQYYNRDPNDISKLLNTPLIPNEVLAAEAIWPAGDIVSTVPDLVRFGSHMIKWSKGLKSSDKFNLKDKTVLDLWHPIAEMDLGFLNMTDKFEYGHGWMIQTLKSPITCKKCSVSPITHLMEHEGGLPGDNTLLIVEPNNEIAVAVFINLSSFKIFEMPTQILKYFIN